MKLLKQICEKKLNKYQNYSMKKYTIRSIWQFYQVVNICVSFLKINGIQTLNSKQIRNRNKLYEKILIKNHIDKKQNIKIQEYVNNDLDIINRTFQLFDSIQDKSSSHISDIEKDFSIGILSQEVEEL